MTSALPATLFKRLAPFNCLSEYRLTQLLNEGRTFQIARGKTVFHAEALQHKAFFLLVGALSLHDKHGAISTVRPDTELEVATARAGVAHCTALEDSIVFSVDRKLLDQYVCWSETQQAHALALALNEESDTDSAWKQALLHSNLFNKVPPLNIALIYQLLKPMRVVAGEYIIKQGDAGDACYFIRQGEAEVSRVQADGQHEVLASIGYGRCVGEDALIHDTQRNASVRMTTDGVIYSLDKHDFFQLLREPSFPRIAIDQVRLDGSDELLIDVRTAQEAARGGCGGMNVPLSVLPLYIRQYRDYLAQFRRVLVYCDSGLRSQAAVSFLSEAGCDAYWIEFSQVV